MDSRLLSAAMALVVAVPAHGPAGEARPIELAQQADASVEVLIEHAALVDR